MDIMFMCVLSNYLPSCSLPSNCFLFLPVSLIAGSAKHSAAKRTLILDLKTKYYQIISTFSYADNGEKVTGVFCPW